tara:strand:+ start:7768 stop:7998 length:231 start_codon:yes stop_codon:yes gene_type:complete
MSKQIDDGGPAYPTPEGDTAQPESGMTLRDWFAGQALVGDLPRYHNCPLPPDRSLALAAYEIADAMIAASKEPTHD